MKPGISVLMAACLLGSMCVGADSDTSGLEWMLGCWTAEDGSGREVWVQQSGRQLIGFSVALDEGRVAFHEVLSITVDERGAHYTAHPQGQSTTTFSSPGLSGQVASFTNAAHDYPQRVDYRLDGDWLRASISLLDGSESRSFDKKRCE